MHGGVEHLEFIRGSFESKSLERIMCVCKAGYILTIFKDSTKRDGAVSFLLWQRCDWFHEDSLVSELCQMFSLCGQKGEAVQTLFLA